MPQAVYIETSIVSYLTARSSRNVVVAAHRLVTRRWWLHHRHRFVLYSSPVVVEEAGRGDPDMAAKRAKALRDTRILRITDLAASLAQALIDTQLVPRKAPEDALHIAIAAAHGIDYLLTWNCRHIANATIRHRLIDLCRAHGLEAPVLCTPEELLVW